MEKMKKAAISFLLRDFNVKQIWVPEVINGILRKFYLKFMFGMPMFQYWKCGNAMFMKTAPMGQMNKAAIIFLLRDFNVKQICVHEAINGILRKFYLNFMFGILE